MWPKGWCVLKITSLIARNVEEHESFCWECFKIFCVKKGT